LPTETLLIKSERKIGMIKKTVILLFVWGISFSAFSQKVIWSGGVHSFFDNVEFGGSKVQIPQTMAGVHLTPEIGLEWDGKHRVLAGFDVMHEYGSNRVIDYYDPIIYYELDNAPWRFYMGAFPRSLVLDKYPRMFFQDSIANYRPTLNGLFWEFYSGDNYFNAWLDWTSRQTRTRHEAFFMGWSGRYNYGIFYGQHFGYMFHFAGVMEPEIPEGLHDNGLILTSLGIDLAAKTGFDRLEANVGWSAGLECDRSLGDWHKLHGLLSEARIEYRGLGVFNTYYRGGSQQIFYNDHANELYWGDPVYRSKEYDRADLYISFIKTNVVNIKMTYSLHFTERMMYHQQMLTATFDLDNFRKKKAEQSTYLWDYLFLKK